MKRIFLFVLTNLAVVFVINITLRLLGVDRWLDASGGINFNALLGESDPPGDADRIITDMTVTPNPVTIEYDEIPATASNWEIGGDYEHVFVNGSRFKTLFIVNEAEAESTREASFM